MSGSAIAYHLRQNKAIERNLFIELLRRIGFVKNISDYQYIGFGGPFLEDYRLLHNALRISDMHSIERDENTHLRQKFNRPVNFIKLHHCDSTTFFRNVLNTEKPSVVWLDYTAPSELGAQIAEFIDVALRLSEFDILKITLNANPSALGHQHLSNQEMLNARLKELEARVGVYFPPSLKASHIAKKRYASALQECIRFAANSLSNRAEQLTFRPMSTFQYSDGGHQMLTVTGIILRPDNVAYRTFLDGTRLRHWEFSNLDWDPPVEISVPNMSLKERLLIEEALPLPKRTRKPAQRLQKKLGFWPCDESEPQKLENYAKFYRAFPYFSKVNPT